MNPLFLIAGVIVIAGLLIEQIEKRKNIDPPVDPSVDPPVDPPVEEKTDAESNPDEHSDGNNNGLDSGNIPTPEDSPDRESDSLNLDS